MFSDSIEIHNSITTKEGNLYITPSKNVPFRSDITNYVITASSESGKVSYSEPYISTLVPKDATLVPDDEDNDTVTANVYAGRITFFLSFTVSELSVSSHSIVITNSLVSSNSTVLVNTSSGICKVSDVSFGSFTLLIYFKYSYTGTFIINFKILN